MTDATGGSVRSISFAVLIVGLLAAVSPALADGRAAEQWFDKGEKLYRKGKVLDAAAAFEKALQELPALEIAFSAAQAYRLGYRGEPDEREQAKLVKRAMELYEQYRRDPGDKPRDADAAAHLASLSLEWRDFVTRGLAKDDRITAEKTQIGVVVPAKVKGATVTIDGVDVSGVDYSDVEPGERVVRVEAPGYAVYEEKVPAAKGAQILVRAELEPRPALVKLKTESGIRVTVDGRAVVPRAGVIEVPSGKRYVTVTRRGRRPYAKELELAPGATVEVDARLARTDQRRIARVVLFGSLGLTGAAAATMTFALIADSRASGRADDGILTDEDAAYYDKWRGRRNTARTATYVLGGAAAIAAGAAIALYLFDNPQAEAPPVVGPDREDTRFTPMVFGDGAGLGIEGSW
jgi:hypothetical protein